MQFSEKDIYLVAATNRTDEWSRVYKELEHLGCVVHTVNTGSLDDDSALLDDLFLSVTTDKIKSADFVLKIGSENDLMTNYQLGAARAFKKRIVNLLFEDSKERRSADSSMYEIIQVGKKQTIHKSIMELLGKIEESSLDIRFNLFIDKRIDAFLKEAVSCSSKSKSEIIRDLIYKEINHEVKRVNGEFWSMPPRIKVLEALGSVADERVTVSIGKNQAMVHASNGKKTYNVSYDESRNIIVSNDNGSYFAEFIGYPAIAMLMKIGKVRCDDKYSDMFKGLRWKPINDRFPGAPEDAEEYVYTQVLKLPISEKTNIQEYCDLILSDLNHMRLQKPDVIPKPPIDI